MTPESIEKPPQHIGELAVDSLYFQQKGLPRGKPWQPGESGNPAGRPRGSRNAATMLAQALLDSDVETLMRKVIERALHGDPLALKLCIERILAPQRQAKVRLELPALSDAADATRAFAAIAAAVADGELAPAEARDLSLVPHGFLRALDAHDFERRLAALERQNAPESGRG